MRTKSVMLTIIALLLLAALACSFGRGGDEAPNSTATPAAAAPPSTSEPAPTVVPATAAAQPAASPTVTPTVRRERLGQAGLIAAYPAGYEIEHAWHRVSLRRRDADPVVGALIEIDSNPFLCGERVPVDLPEALEWALQCAVWWFDGGDVASTDPVAGFVDGVPSLTVELEGRRDGAAVNQRLTVLKPGPTRVLVFSARAPEGDYPEVSNDLPALVDAVELLTWQTFTNGNDVEDVVFFDGYLWTATGGGGVAWPLGGGISPVKYTVADGLPANDLRALTICPVGGELTLFAGTWGGGVARFDPGRRLWVDLGGPYAEWADRYVNALACALDNRLVVGYGDGGVDLLNLDEVLWYHFSRDEGILGDLRALAAARTSAQVWAIGEEGLALISDTGPVPDPGVTGAVTYQAGLDSEDTLWAAAFDRVVRRTSDGEWSSFDNGDVADLFATRVTGLAVAADQSVWLGSYNQIARFDPALGEVVELYREVPGMVPGPVGRLTLDDWTGWLGYTVPGMGAGVLKDGEWLPFILDREPLSDNATRALVLDADGHLWVGDRSGHLWLADPSAIGRPVGRFELPRGFALSVYPDPEGGVWVGHFDGASLYTLEGALHLSDVLPRLADHYVRAIARDATGRLWLGGDEGLFIWDEVRLMEMDETDGLPGTEIRALQPDGGAMWVGTTQGLARIEGAGIDTFAVGEVALPDDLIGALALDPWGDLLVATGSSLLIRKADGAFEPILESDWDSPLTAIAVSDEGEIWVTTARDGVYSLQFQGEAADWQHLSARDGLPSNDYGAYAVVIDRDGAVWLGGASGGLGRYGP